MADDTAQQGATAQRGATAGAIEAWFATYRQEGEYDYSRQPPAYQVLEPAGPGGRMLFVSRQPLAVAIREQSPTGSQLGLVAPLYGLPCHADGIWLKRIVTGELVFLGDLDPVDLLIFAWLRAKLPEQTVTHLGVGDAYLRTLKAVIPRSAVPRLSAAEQAAMALLSQAFPDYETVVGPKCAGVLKQGQKLELEGLATAVGSLGALLAPAFGKPE